jgi:hypothetical protein
MTEDRHHHNGYYCCSEDASLNSYCCGCGKFWAGCEDFDFEPSGLCLNCRMIRTWRELYISVLINPSLCDIIYSKSIFK